MSTPSALLLRELRGGPRYHPSSRLASGADDNRGSGQNTRMIMQLSVVSGLQCDEGAEAPGSKRAQVGRLHRSSLSSAQGPREAAAWRHEVLDERQLLAAEEPQGDWRFPRAMSRVQHPGAAHAVRTGAVRPP